MRVVQALAEQEHRDRLAFVAARQRHQEVAMAEHANRVIFVGLVADSVRIRGGSLVSRQIPGRRNQGRCISCGSIVGRQVVDELAMARIGQSNDVPSEA